jgi:hypothetical protein
MNNNNQEWFIIGGGTAGLWIAKRILELTKNINVTIIEQGGSHIDDEKTRLSKNIGSVMYNPEYTKPIEAKEGTVRTGSCLGGGSSINGAYLVYPNDNYLNRVTNESTGTKVSWGFVRELVKSKVPYTEIKPSAIPFLLNEQVNPLLKPLSLESRLTSDLFYSHEGKRISSLSFLEPYLKDPRLHIIDSTTVEQFYFTMKKDKTVASFVLNELNTTFYPDRIILATGAYSPQLLLKSKIKLDDVVVKCHIGKELILDIESVHRHKDNMSLEKNPLVKNTGQIIIKDSNTKEDTSQLIFYGKSILIYNLNPSLGWKPTLSSRGDLFYTDDMMSNDDKSNLDKQIEVISQVIPIKIKDGYSLSYHMTGGCHRIIKNFKLNNVDNLFIADLSVLNDIPNGNTSFMALMVGEKFIQECVI